MPLSMIPPAYYICCRIAINERKEHTLIWADCARVCLQCTWILFRSFPGDCQMRNFIFPSYVKIWQSERQRILSKSTWAIEHRILPHTDGCKCLECVKFPLRFAFQHKFGDRPKATSLTRTHSHHLRQRSPWDDNGWDSVHSLQWSVWISWECTFGCGSISISNRWVDLADFFWICNQIN